AGFNDVGVWKLEESGIRNSDHVGIRINPEIREPLNAAHVFAVRSGTVHRPAHTLLRKEIPAAEFRTAKILGNEPPKSTVAILRVSEAGEEELHVVVGGSVGHHEQHDASGARAQTDE